VNPARRPALPLSLSPLTTGGASTEDDIALCHHAGLERIGVSMAKLAAGGRDAIAASGLTVDVVYPAVGLDLRAPASWETARAGILAAVDTAAALSASAVLFPAGAAGGLLWDDAVAALDSAMAPVIDAVDGSGVRLLLEPVRPQFAYASFVHSFRDGVVLARRFGTGLVFDVTHCWWEPGLADVIAGAVDLIGTVHLADLALDRPVISRLVPGDGALPLEPILALLHQHGYTGPYELELIGPAIDEEGAQDAVRRAIAHLNSLLPSEL
jgi:sugar phosphate isomerase/epimerase